MVELTKGSREFNGKIFTASQMAQAERGSDAWLAAGSQGRDVAQFDESATRVTLQLPPDARVLCADAHPRLYVIPEDFAQCAMQACIEGDVDWLRLVHAAIERFGRHQHVRAALLHVSCRHGEMSREPEGWLEFLLVIHYTGGGKLVIGCIQRTPGGEFEFHS